MRLVRIWLLLAAVTVSGLAQPGAPEVRKLSLEDCIQSALQKNLDLQIARYNVPLATLNLQGSYAGWDPSFNLGATHSFNSQPGQFDPSLNTLTFGNATYNDNFNASLGGLTPWGLNYNLLGNVNQSAGILGTSEREFESSGGNAAIQLRQPLLKNFWIDATRLNIRVAKNRVKYSEQGLRLLLMQTITTVEDAYYDLIYDRENVTVQQKAYELAEQLVVENKKRVEVGAMAPLDEQQAESQAATTQAALIAARAALAVQEHTVKQLITDEYSKWANISIEASGTLTTPRQFFNVQDSWSKGLSQRPDLLQAKLDVERQGVIIKYNQNQLFPELDIVGSYGHNAGGLFQYSQSFGQLQQGTYPAYSVGGQLSFPIANIGARAAYKSSKVTLEQLMLALKRLEQTVMVQIDDDIKRAESGYQQVAASRTAREYAAAALEAEQKKLESGKSTTYTVLQMQRDLTSARGNEILALDNYNKALAQLSLDEGSTLQRLGINLEIK
jgi:outer membrane protein